MSAIATQGYTVRAGDTLSAIARHFGVSVAAIAAANGIADVDKIRIGQVLQIPAVGPQVVGASASSSFGVLKSDANAVPAKPAVVEVVREVDKATHKPPADKPPADKPPAGGLPDRVFAFIDANKIPLALLLAGGVGLWWMSGDDAHA